MIRLVPIAIITAALGSRAWAHDSWANGDPIPDWVAKSCCGPAEAHRLTSDQVSENDHGYVVLNDGLALHIRRDRTLPSQDGHYWIFYQPSKFVGETYIYCFFAPLNG